MTFTCDICNNEYATNGGLKLHIKQVHNKIKDVKCDKCKYVCSSNGDLKQHVKQVHDMIRDVKCDKCEYTCSTNSTLKKHVKQVHDKVKDVKCDKCQFTCSTNGNLKTHIKQVHDKIKDVKCDKCKFVCSSNSYMKQHKKRIHERPHTDKRMSLGEFAIYTYLSNHGIEFEQEKTFNDLLSRKYRRLRYDFAVNHNDIIMLIEFDGKQHFQKVKWQSNETEQQVEARYNYMLECDKKKDDYAEQNDYKLLRIKYTDIKNIDSILTDFLNL